MTNREQRKLVRTRIEAGASPQQVYDELHGPGNAADEQLADLIRCMPTAKKLRKYSTPSTAMIALLMAVIAVELVLVVQWPYGAVLDIILVVGFCASLVALALNQVKVYRLLPLLALLAGMHALQHTPDSRNPLLWLLLGLLSAVMVIGFYLDRRLSGDYELVKESYTNAKGQPDTREVVRFKD